METDVIVVGAGPVGLMLAGELRLGGANVTVLERLETPTGESRGLGITARAYEVFDQRGLLTRFPSLEPVTQGHFGGMPLDFGILEGAIFTVRGIWQSQIEKALQEWVTELGAVIKRGHEVTGLTDLGDRVVVTTEGPAGRGEATGAYLVGCDGGRSTVRRLAGIEFSGTDATREMYLADVIGRKIRPRFIGERVLGGMAMSAPLEPGVDRIIVCEDGVRPREGRRDVTFDEVADAWQRLTGEALHGAETRWVSGFTDATRQAAQYRQGRVFLAGDAAHIHLPAGGQGLSIGIQDAVNLGWKLAAQVRGWAPDSLLDSYHGERHPVGARVLRNTLAQGMLYLSGERMDPLRTVMRDIIAIPDAGCHLAGMVSGLDIRYDMGAPAGHPLVGARMPDSELELRDGGHRRLVETLHAARGVLISVSESAAKPGATRGWADRVDVVAVRRFPTVTANGSAVPEAALIRPDGYVAWAATPGGDEPADALRRWFGEPAAEAAVSAREPVTAR